MIIISTSRGVFNLEKREFFHECGAVCFGLAKSQSRSWELGKGRKMLHAAFRISHDSGWSRDTKICSFDKSLNLVNEFKIQGCEDVHGIEDFDNSIYALSTKTNKIYQTDLSGELLHIYDGIPECDRSHMNTIKKHGDRLLIVCHRDKYDAESCLYEFNPKTKEITCVSRSLGDHSHSLLYFKDRLWVCDSLNGRVFSVNKHDHVREPKTSPQLRTVTHVQTDGGYLLRGLAFDKEYLYLGASGKASNAERHEGCDGGIIKMKKEDGEVLEKILIPECGQVNEILSY
jgi:hypothetical protein